MTSTPDSISTSDLMAFAEQAIERQEVEDAKKVNGPFPNGLTEEQYHDAVLGGLQDLHESFSHPMFAKVVSLELLNKLVQWHSDRATEVFADGDPDCGICWARDAGKIQAAMENIVQVMLPDDYIFRAHGNK